MVGNTHALLVGASLGLLFGSPWLVASALLWRRRIRDDSVAPSMGELARRRFFS
jgi:hypothetical protein